MGTCACASPEASQSSFLVPKEPSASVGGCPNCWFIPGNKPKNKDTTHAQAKSSTRRNSLTHWLSLYSDIFIKHGYYNMNTIQQIKDESQLHEMGIVDKEHQALIMGAIDSLQTKAIRKTNRATTQPNVLMYTNASVSPFSSTFNYHADLAHTAGTKNRTQMIQVHGQHDLSYTEDYEPQEDTGEILEDVDANESITGAAGVQPLAHDEFIVGDDEYPDPEIDFEDIDSKGKRSSNDNGHKDLLLR
eukprot:389924_1